MPRRAVSTSGWRRSRTVASRSRVVDDGVGFDVAVPHPGHLGLHTMPDRAEAVRGVLDLVSGPGHGSEVRLTVPLRH